LWSAVAGFRLAGRFFAAVIGVTVAGLFLALAVAAALVAVFRFAVLLFAFAISNISRCYPLMMYFDALIESAEKNRGDTEQLIDNIRH
jgi:uncharacterized membrane protein YphA (DoxX/SURF4 family)